MLTLITGQPGAGKTHHVLRTLQDISAKDGRSVYTWNVRGLVERPGWHVIENPHLWYEEVPPGSIIFMDEVQEAFPPQARGATVPESVARLAKHRHEGWDFFVTTQSITQTHTQLRAVVGEHWHVVRLSKRLYAVNVYPKCVNPNDRKDQRLRVSSSKRRYDLAVFDGYESTVADTHKKKVPLKLLMLPLALCGIPFLGWYAVSALSKDTDDVIAGAEAAAGVPVGVVGTLGESEPYRSTESFREWWRPRISDLPWSAPAYDQAAKVQDLPKTFCVSSEERCQCYTQQGTRVSTEARFCRHAAKFGVFDPFRDPDSNRNSSRDNDRNENNFSDRYKQAAAQSDQPGRAPGDAAPLTAGPGADIPVSVKATITQRGAPSGNGS